LASTVGIILAVSLDLVIINQLYHNNYLEL